jgi:ABC-type Fe3+ transport system substrate-binding protein
MANVRPNGAPVSREMRGWILAAAGLGCFFAGVWVTHSRKVHATTVTRESANTAPRASTTTEAREAPTTGVTLSLVYSSEIAAWLTPALADFARVHPEVRVQAQPMGSLDAERAIANGRVRPTLWIPADTSAVEMLDGDRGAQGLAVVREEGRWPRALTLTPMVFVVWESRAHTLAGNATTLSWTRLQTVARSPRGWSEIGGDRAWGGLKFGHTDPTRSHAGLNALVLMAYGWRGTARSLTPADVTGAGFEGFVRTLEAADPAGDRGTGSSGEFAQTIALQGPGRYDVAMVYESQAIASMDVARGRWGESLRVYYPPVNVWSDHPLCLLDGAHVGAAERDAAEKLADHLRSSEVQAAAVRHGLRPADVRVPIVSDDPENPFVKYRDRGVTVALPQVADAPSLAALDAITSTWRRATGR